MTNKEMIIEVLKKHSCLTSFEIKGFIYRTYNVNLTPASISGTLRPVIAAGLAAASKNSDGKTVYWLTNPEWRK